MLTQNFENPNQFDILDYLNDVYMNKIIPTIDVSNAGGHHNIHGNENDAKEEINENNKKRIHIPNAEIKYFQVGQQEDFEEYNESTQDDTGTSKNKYINQDGAGNNETSFKGTEERSISGSNPQDIVKISEKNPTKKLITTGAQATNTLETINI